MARRLLFLLASACLIASDSPQSWTPAHSMKFRNVGEVTPSPDGRRVAWIETWAVMDKEKSEYRTHIFLGASDGSERIQLTRGDKSCDSIQFSPDGRYLFFASERSGKKNFYRIGVSGGEAEMLTDWKGALGSYRVSPDGSRLAFTGAEEDKEREERKKSKSDWRVIDEPAENQTLWMLDLAGDMPGEAEKLVEAEYHIGDFDWSPDSRFIAYSHTPTPKPDDARRANLAEVVVEAKKVRTLAATDREESRPLYSPDGRYLAYLRPAGSRPRLDGTRIVLHTRAGGGERELPATPDEAPQVAGWIGGSRSLLFSEARGTRIAIYRIPVDGPVEQLSTETGTLSPARFNQTGTHAGFTIQTPDKPVEAYVAPVTGGRLGKSVQVSRANEGVALPPLGKTEIVRWKSNDGHDVDGLLTYPVGYVSGRRVPLVLVIHGGPSGVFLESFIGAPGLYPVASFAAKGYAVLRPNPRGSTGYGAGVRRMVVQDWGGGDFADLMSGVDHVVAKGIADPERLAVMGWSYGGYMTAWTVTQTARFRAAAIGAGITNHVSMYGTQDIPSVYEDYFGGAPWQEKDVYVKSSPIAHVENARTPTLILHGENDLRVPIGQAYEFHRALKRQGIAAEMVAYPRMPHGPNEPKFLLDVAERHLAWVERWLSAR